MKQLILLLPLTFSLASYSGNIQAQWIEYATRSNGDVYFYDDSRVDRQADQITVWTRVRYKTSVMAASSYQSLITINCAENSETVLQNTFFTDKDWTKPAMATNTNVKPKRMVAKNSATEKLMRILCAQ